MAKRSTDSRVTHGHCASGRSRTYVSWEAMRARCLNPKSPSYKYYGGRGIKIDPRWLVFENFLEDMGSRPPGTSLDRYPEKNGHYQPGNCRWATPQTQARNTRSNRVIHFNGESKTLMEWAEIYQINRVTLRNRLNFGWSVADALSREKYSRVRKDR